MMQTHTSTKHQGPIDRFGLVGWAGPGPTGKSPAPLVHYCGLICMVVPHTYIDATQTTKIKIAKIWGFGAPGHPCRRPNTQDRIFACGHIRAIFAPLIHYCDLICMVVPHTYIGATQTTKIKIAKIWGFGAPGHRPQTQATQNPAG